MKYVTTVDEREFTLEVVDEHHIVVDGEVFTVDFAAVSGQPVFSLLLDGKSYEAYVYAGEEGWEVLLRGDLFSVKVEDERERRLRAALEGSPAQVGEFHLKAPMPGLVVAILVDSGQAVAKGDVLVILESMKMQNELRSPRDGVVQRVRVRQGDSVERNQTLLSVA